MDVHQTTLAGVVLFSSPVHRDDRGFFVRTFDAAAFAAAGIPPETLVQDSQSRSRQGVIRGLHLRGGHGEAKLVRCARGSIFDVVVDLRRDSPTFLKWESFSLDDENLHVLHIPRGFGHGWQALSDVADVCYRIDAEHDPSEDVSIRWDDPQLGIRWPLPATSISERDRAAPSLAAALAELP